MKSSQLRLLGGIALVGIAIIVSLSGCSANAAPGEQLITRAPDASIAFGSIRMQAAADLAADGSRVEIEISVAKFTDPSREIARVNTTVPVGSTQDVSTGEDAGADTFKITASRKGEDVVVTIYSRITDNGRVSQPSVRFLAKAQAN